FNGTVKHFSVNAYSVEGAKDIIKMGEIVAGGLENLKKRPLVSINVLSLSPLRFDPVSIKILMEVAKTGIPLIIASEPQAGTTAPVTLAGTITLQNAESLAGIVLAQLVNPGTPVLCGSVGTIADMRTGQYASGAVELGIINAIAAQMAQYYKIPIYSTGGMTDSKIPDIQAGYEKGLQTLMVALSGANYIHDAAGLLEFCLSASYEQTVIDNEICGMVARALQGVSLEKEMIGLDVIDKVGPGGHFLEELHTLKYFKKEHFIPEISDRQNRQIWEAKGSKTANQVAREKARKILKEHFPTPLDEKVKKELNYLVKKAR
ncbi:MAG TPA: trimethylamine methyltransferase, partial [Candidatus Aminicenantes bacterium]|nr:trimethylamine methyltransferase [Candidatus Aminicenantes bacterium]